MTKRGKVLRDTTSGQGLLMVEGQQYRFSQEAEWKSESTPKPGQVVDVELDSQGKVQSVRAVSDSQLAMERAEGEMASARRRGRSLGSASMAKIGMPSLAVAGILAAAWFFLTAATVQVPFPGKLELTFWQMLGFLNAGKIPEMFDGTSGPSSGLYGFAAVVALAGPFIPLFWKDKRALLGGLLPLVFMAIVGFAVRSSFYSTNGGNGDIGGQAHMNTLKAFSLGSGAYLSILASLYFAFVSAKGLVARSPETQTLKSTPRKAA